MPAPGDQADGAGDGPEPRAGRERQPRARHGSASRWESSAAGRSSLPSARRSTAATATLGATVKWAGDWRRAYDYGDPEGEALAVNSAAGLIDVSTLGKLLVRGADAGEFLDRLYPNRFSNLKPGRIRYGVISSDAGRIVDDGTICRLDERELLRHHDLQRRRRGRGVVLVVAGRLGPRCPADRPDPGPVGGQPRRPARRARSWARSPISTAPTRRSRTSTASAATVAGVALPAPADRVRRRGRLRDPLPVGLRRAPVGRAARGRRAVRSAAVRARAAADPAAAEDAHPRRAGHRLGVDAVRRRDAVDRQARQGAGLHRKVGARALQRGDADDRAGRLHASQRRRSDRGRGGRR